MKQVFKYVYSIFITLIISLTVYLIVHELGHAMIAELYGAEITGFSVVNAHVTWEGGNIGPFESALIYAGGTIFPVVLLLICLIFYNKNSKNFAYNLLYGFSTAVTICTSIVWVLYPMLPDPPQSDDATKFMESVPQVSHLWISLSGLIIILSLLLIAYKKGLWQNTIDFIKNGSKEEYYEISTGSVIILTAIGSILISLALFHENNYNY